MKDMKLKLTSGNIYDTKLHPTLQNLTNDDIREIMRMIRNDTNMVINHNY